jgi:hypothetical protein
MRPKTRMVRTQNHIYGRNNADRRVLLRPVGGLGLVLGAQDTFVVFLRTEDG